MKVETSIWLPILVAFMLLTACQWVGLALGAARRAFYSAPQGARRQEREAQWNLVVTLFILGGLNLLVSYVVGIAASWSYADAAAGVFLKSDSESGKFFDGLVLFFCTFVFFLVVVLLIIRFCFSPPKPSSADLVHDIRDVGREQDWRLQAKGLKEIDAEVGRLERQLKSEWAKAGLDRRFKEFYIDNDKSVFPSLFRLCRYLLRLRFQRGTIWHSIGILVTALVGISMGFLFVNAVVLAMGDSGGWWEKCVRLVGAAGVTLLPIPTMIWSNHLRLKGLAQIYRDDLRNLSMVKKSVKSVRQRTDATKPQQSKGKNIIVKIWGKEVLSYRSNR